MMLRILFALLLFAFVIPAAAQGTGASEKELKRIEQQRRVKEKESKERAAHAAKIKTEVDQLKKDLVAASQRLAEQEEKLEALQMELVNTEQEERRTSRLRNDNQKDLSEVLAVLLRVARLPPEAVVFAPTPPQQVIYTTYGMQQVMQELGARVATARDQLAKLAVVQEKLKAQQAAISAAEADLANDRAKLADLVKQREAAHKKTEAERIAADKEAKKLARRASDLRDLIQKLKANSVARKKQNKGKATNAALYATGTARLPVRGSIVRAYGTTDPAGNRHRGVTVRTAAGALVNAPLGGQVVFAGAFRSYGQVVIIELSGDRHVLLTGLGTISVSEGEGVQAGEPVGRMPTGETDLYLETRKNSEPVDPATFGLTQSSRS